ncbi:protein kinase [Achlya hypogyna]|uniref:Protein kinase n=1 Tax=Achlya hypogyna TaxID=1202772 RepID=A0A1V9ZJG5_ACHHY|nr:protein kinase [Achlya hypogyna]
MSYPRPLRVVRLGEYLLELTDVSFNNITNFNGIPAQLAILYCPRASHSASGPPRNMSHNQLHEVAIGPTNWAATMDFSANPTLSKFSCMSPLSTFSFSALYITCYRRRDLECCFRRLEGSPVDPLSVDNDCLLALQRGRVYGTSDATHCDYTLETLRNDIGPPVRRSFRVCLLPGTYSEKTWHIILAVESFLGIVFTCTLIVYHQCAKSHEAKRSNKPVVRRSVTVIDATMSEGDAALIEPLRPYLVDPLHFRIDASRVLGRGAHGVVVRGQYRRRAVAVKRVRRDIVSPEALAAFVQEVELMAILRSPYIVEFVGVHWHQTAQSLACLVEYMAQGDLRASLANHEHKPAAWTLGVATDVAQALVYLHTNGVVHRDLKSRNVLLDAGGRAKVGDMGVAKRVVVAESMTNAVGTYRWTAPEVLRGTSYDTKADIYSFAMILTELDSHRAPYEDARNDRGQVLGNFSLLYKVMEGTITPTFTPQCPAWLRDLATACASFDPARRPTAPEPQIVYPSVPTIVNASFELLHQLPPNLSQQFEPQWHTRFTSLRDLLVGACGTHALMEILLCRTLEQLPNRRNYEWPPTLASLSLIDTPFGQPGHKLPPSLLELYDSNVLRAITHERHDLVAASAVVGLGYPPGLTGRQRCKACTSSPVEGLKHLARTLSGNAMQSFTAKHRDVSSNLIEVFEGIPSLQFLNMSNNRLRNIEIGDQSWATIMYEDSRQLDFSENPYLERIRCTDVKRNFKMLYHRSTNELRHQLSTLRFWLHTNPPGQNRRHRPRNLFIGFCVRYFTLFQLPASNIVANQFWLGYFIANGVLAVISSVVLAMRLTRSFCFSIATARRSTRAGILLEQPPMLLSDDEVRVLLPLEPYRLDDPAVPSNRHLGRGGHADVVLGSYRGRPVAIKQIRRDLVSAKMVHEFVNEIRLMARLQCPFLVDFVGVQWSDFLHLQCVVEFMANGDLRSYLEQHSAGVFTWSDKRRVAIAVARALDYLHTHGVVHRDLKSRNILLDHELRAKVADFGIARQVTEESMTNAVGTYRWTAPEVLEGKHYNEKADIYSFAMVLLELDSHKVPFADAVNSRGQTLGSFTLLYKPRFSSECPDWLRCLTLVCGASDPAARPSAAEILHLLVKTEDADSVTSCDSSSESCYN